MKRDARAERPIAYALTTKGLVRASAVPVRWTPVVTPAGVLYLPPGSKP